MTSERALLYVMAKSARLPGEKFICFYTTRQSVNIKFVLQKLSAISTKKRSPEKLRRLNTVQNRGKSSVP